MSLGVLLSDQWLLSLLQDRPFNQHNAIVLQDGSGGRVNAQRSFLYVDQYLINGQVISFKHQAKPLNDTASIYQIKLAQ